MRCIFRKGKQRELLISTKQELGLSWRELAKKLGIGYTTLREWRDEKWSMQQVVFDKLINVCPGQAKFRNFIVEIKEDNWGRARGGFKTKELRHGFFNTEYAEQSAGWKSKGGQIGTRNWHAKMKNEHPYEYGKIQYDRIKQSLKYKFEFNGQKYRNYLELAVAKILTKRGNPFEYERSVNYGIKCYFPDFTIGELVVECTFWDDVAQKAKELSDKIQNYRKLKIETIVVTSERYVKNYSELLSHLNVTVITPDKLTEVLDGKFGRVKRV